MQVRPTGPAPAKIMIVGEAPGEEEVRRGEPFVGASGMELNRMLQEAGIMRSQCFVTNVCRERPFANDINNFIAKNKTSITPKHQILRNKFVLPPVWEGLELLKREIELVKPNVIIACGNVSMWALTGKWGITSWRASTLECDLDLGLDYKPKVIPVYHPAAVLRQWSWRNILVQDLRRARVESGRREIMRPDYQFITRPSYETALNVLDQLLAQVALGPKKLSCDIETRMGQIACIGVGWSATEAMCIPLMDNKGEGMSYWPLEQEVEVVWRLLQLINHPNCYVIGQNFSYDAQYFWRYYHFIPNCVWDTMLAQHSCFANVQKGLDFLSSMYCTFHEYWKDEGKEWNEKTGEDQLWTYNCKDCVVTFEAAEVEEKNIAAMNLTSVNAFQQRMFWPVLNTMNRGVRVDAKRRNRFAMELTDAIAEREQWIADVVGYPLNIRSPKQMQELFYDQLGQKPVYNRANPGAVTVNDEALRRIADREPILRPLIRRIQELRSLGVFLSTFIGAPLDVDGRMRCSYNIAGTETYRFSSSKNAFGSGLNLQNIPSGGGEDSDGLQLPNVRTLFIPDPGCTFFDIDLSSADLRIVVWEADEPEMKAMLREGLDPYTEIAKEFYHDPSITKKDPRRQKFKAFAHGTNYLGTAKGLAERLGLSVHEAEKTQNWYFGRFSRIKKWQDDLKDQVFKRRMVQNVFGYRCYIFDRVEGTVFNQAAAWIPQSTVGCIINRGYMRLFEEHPEIEVLLQVHDSLAGQFATRTAETAIPIIKSSCEVVLPYDDPLVIPVGIKTSTVSWGDCK